MFAAHPNAAHFRYPYLYGPYQPVPREWSVVRRILDGRQRIVVADEGLTLHHHCYTENCGGGGRARDRAPASAARGRSSTSATRRCSRSGRWSSCARASSAPTSRSCRCRTTSRSRRGRCSTQPLPTHRVLDLTRVHHQLGHRDVVPRAARPCAAPRAGSPSTHRNAAASRSRCSPTRSTTRPRTR